MSSLLNVIENEAVDNQRRVIAAARQTCDYCGTPFRYGYSYCGNGGGYRHQKITVRCDGRYYVACSDRCRDRLVGYVMARVGRTPRLIGRETVEGVLR